MTKSESERRLGLIDATAVVVSACIGIGIFFSPATVAARTGSGGWALAAWAVGGVLAVIGGLCFAELGAMRPDMGGQFRVLREAWGRPVGFAYAGTSGLIINTGAVAVLAGYGTDFLGQAFGWKLDGAAWLAVSVTLIAVLAVVNCIGLRRAADLLDVLTLGKLLTILGIGVGAIVAATSGVPKHATSPFALGGAPTSGGLMFALMPVLFATGGWQQVLWAAGDIRHPDRNIPRALIIGIGTVLFAYFTVNAACLWLLGHEAMATSKTVASDALAVVHADAGRWLAGAIGLSAIGTVHVILFTSSREQAAFGRTGDGPAWIASVDPKTGSARRAVLAMAVWSTLLLVIAGRGGIESLLDAVVMADFAFLALGALAVLRFRAMDPQAPRPFRCPGGPVFPIAFATTAVVVAATPWTVEKMRPWAVAVTLVVVGLLLLGRIRSRGRCEGVDRT